MLLRLMISAEKAVMTSFTKSTGLLSGTEREKSLTNNLKFELWQPRVSNSGSVQVT